jgi:acetamidase/formamidase
VSRARESGAPVGAAPEPPPAHVVMPERRTLHGHFSAELAPVLTIDPGERVRFATLDAGWGLIENPDPLGPAPRFEPRDPRLDDGHALCGPIAIRGAEPGMTLVVHVEEVRPGRWGRTSAGAHASALNRRLGIAEGSEEAIRWALDPDAGTARDAEGRTVRLRPFMGVMGMPPPEPGIHSTIPPRRWGGNIDCRELIAGSTLYLPVPVAGGRFSVGDGHAVQGDGEVSGLALECPMERVTLSFELEPRELAMPRAHTAAGWITFGFHQDLDEAAAIALDGMLDWMAERFGVTRRRALALASLVVDLRITQMVNEAQGVHAVLPDGALPPR